MSKKAEARVAKRLAKQLKQKEKTIRIRENPADHTVRSEYAKDAPREVRAGADPGSIFQMQMRWTVVGADRDGQWSWGVNRDWSEDTWKAALLPKLKEFGKLKWAEIEAQTYGNEGKRHRSNHSMETTQICNEAQRRMREIQRHHDTVFRFRLGNKPRLWGVRIVDEFQVLWYDPTHEIYPLDC